VTTRLLRALALGVAVSTLAGCASLSSSSLTSWIPSIPAPNWDRLFGKSNKPGPLPEVKGTRNPQLDWQVAVGKSGPGFAPEVTAQSVYAASSEGTIVRLDGATGRAVWRTNANRRLSAGPGADDERVVVGTDKGDVLAFDANGNATWTAHVSTEVVAPPRIAGNVVVVFAGDGRVFGLAAADGKTLWVHQRTNPSLTVRNYAGGAVSRGGLFLGTPGGRLVGIDTQTGTVGYDVAVATPKGATELERIADITSLPLIDERTVCAAAYQGRVACFEVVRGTVLWTRDISSLAGLTGDDRNLYVTDDRGAVHALDRTNGASVWKQDVLAARRVGGPQLLGRDLVGVVDVEGYLHVLSRADGSYVGRLATDGSPPTGQPSARGASIVWQSDNGNVYSVAAR
jgi:outer membrane protein assembly factor BamB